MRETLRLAPPITARSTSALEDTFLVGGDGNPENPVNKKYAVKKDQYISVQAVPMMRDPRVWGDDAEIFRPERMMGGNFEKLPVRRWSSLSH